MENLINSTLFINPTQTINRMGFFQLHKTQKVPADLTAVWDFISAPDNLKRITPPSMGFEITSSKSEKKMYPGMIISYRVRPLLNIPTSWVTEITHVKEFEYFVDEQRIGPYKMWHHEHHIENIEGGVLMTDVVSYQPPMGILGSFANFLFIQKKLKQIFDFRTTALEEIFGKWAEKS